MRYSTNPIVAIASFVAVMLVAGTESLLAQERPLTAGTRVRVTAPGALSARVSGGVVEVSDDQLSVRVDESHALVRVPLKSVTELEISRGKGGNAGKGALMGGVINGGATLVLGLLVVATDDGFYDANAGDLAAATALGVVGGAAIGALIGAFVKTEKWERLPLDNVRLQVQPEAGGVTAGVSIRL